MRKDIYKLLILNQDEYEVQGALRNQLEGLGGIIRAEWPKVYTSPKYGGWMSRREEHPIRLIVTTQQERVIAHAGIIRRIIKMRPRDIVFAGLGGVIVKKERRGEGWGANITSAATDWLHNNSEQFGFDLGILSCHPEHVGFYNKFGWQRVRGQDKFLFGEDALLAEPHKETILSIPLSIDGAYFLDDLMLILPLYMGQFF